MLYRLGVLLSICACGFSGANGADAPIGLDDGRPNNGPNDGPKGEAFCNADDPALVVCYQFEGNTRDGSRNGLDATMTNVTFPPGKVGLAMQFGATSAADVPNNTAIDVAAITIEAWIRPSELPSSGRAGILDVDPQFGVFFFPDGSLRCTLSGGPSLPVPATRIAVNRWTHMACTYDGVSAAALYLDGVLASSVTGGGSLSTGGNSGLSLAADNPPGSGDQMIGLIDEVRIMNVARTPAQICADAGRTDCP